MTEQVPAGGAPSPSPSPAPSPAPTPSPSPAPTPSPAPDATKTPSPAPDAAGEFKIPDAYKEKPWAAKIKTQEDLFKQLDGAQELIGKKVLPQIDFTKATPEELDKFNEAHRPAEVSAYGLKDLGLADDHPVGAILHKAGVPVHQGKAIVAEYQKAEAAALANATSAEGFKSAMTDKFGEKYEAVVAQSVQLHKQHLSPDTQKLFDGLPNNVLAGIYELTENMRKAYGVEETGAQGGDNKGGVPAADVTEVRKKLRADIAALQLRPHSAAEKQKLVDELQATYTHKK